jgi:hypothetical protein
MELMPRRSAAVPISRHQGIKGAKEFERVVVLDDEKSTNVQFSHDKYFGVKEP